MTIFTITDNIVLSLNICEEEEENYIGDVYSSVTINKEDNEQVFDLEESIFGLE